VIVVAVKDIDIDSCLCHAARELAELAGFVLPQALNEDFALVKYPNARRLERAPGGCPVVEQKVGYPLAIHGERTPALDADTSASERVAHISEGPGTVFECDS
jgi:hypothetical protein